MQRFWVRILLFFAGTALCVLLYLFLLNLRQLNTQSATHGVIPVSVLAATMWWLTARFLRADAMPANVLGLVSFRAAATHLLVGLVGGSVLTMSWMAVVTVLLAPVWQWNPLFRVDALMMSTVFHVFNNLGEELAYRGYAFVRLADRFGNASVALLTAAVFALLHWQSGIPLPNVVAGVFTSGLIFGAVFARWRSLPLTFGVHLATNLVQDASGLRSSASSLLASTSSTMPTHAGQTALVAVAAINTAVAVAIMRTRRAG